VEKDERLPVVGKDLLQKQTKPKPFFTEATLLKAMETAGKEIDDEELRQAMKETGSVRRRRGLPSLRRSSSGPISCGKEESHSNRERACPYIMCEGSEDRPCRAHRRLGKNGWKRSAEALRYLNSNRRSGIIPV
jgi:hypothetical protein